MNTIIVDDDQATLDIIESFALNTKVVNLIKKCINAKEASDTLLREKIDLIFLDVVMPEINGIEFMSSLQGNMPQVIMISTNDNFAKDAFNLDATDFLVKPITYTRFFKAVSKAKKSVKVPPTSTPTSQVTRFSSKICLFYTASIISI